MRKDNTRFYQICVCPDLRLPAVTLISADSASGVVEIHSASIVSRETTAGSSSSRRTGTYGEHALIGDDTSKTTLQKHTTNHI